MSVTLAKKEGVEYQRAKASSHHCWQSNGGACLLFAYRETVREREACSGAICFGQLACVEHPINIYLSTTHTKPAASHQAKKGGLFVKVSRRRRLRPTCLRKRHQEFSLPCSRGVNLHTAFVGYM
jgi:hypothetical protein